MNLNFAGVTTTIIGISIRLGYAIGTGFIGVTSAFFLLACQTSEPAQSSATSNTPSVKSMHPSWDVDGDGINDCENDGSCDHTHDYTEPRQQTQAAASAIKPTFACDGAQLSSVEQRICTDSDLARLDQEMAKTYQQALTSITNEDHKRVFKAVQRGWIKGRNDCWKEPDLKKCVESSYKRRQAEIEARFRLVPSSIAVAYFCENNQSNEFIVTYFSTDPATAIVERGDNSELLYRQDTPDGLIYTAGDYTLTEYNGQAKIRWGYGTDELTCAVRN